MQEAVHSVPRSGIEPTINFPSGVKNPSAKSDLNVLEEFSSLLEEEAGGPSSEFTEGDTNIESPNSQSAELLRQVTQFWPSLTGDLVPENEPEFEHSSNKNLDEGIWLSKIGQPETFVRNLANPTSPDEGGSSLEKQILPNIFNEEYLRNPETSTTEGFSPPNEQISTLDSNNNLASKLMILEENEKELQANLDFAQAHILELNTELQASAEDCIQLQAKLFDAEKKVEAKEIELSHQEEANSILHLSVDDLQTVLPAISEFLEDLSQSDNVLGIQVKNCATENLENLKALTIAERKIENEMEDKSELKTQILELEDAYSKVEKISENSRGEIFRTRAQLNISKEALQRSQDTLINLSDQNKGELESKSVETFDLRCQLNSAEDALQRSQTLIIDLGRDLQEKEKKFALLEEKIRKSEYENNELRDQTAKVDQENLLSMQKSDIENKKQVEALKQELKAERQESQVLASELNNLLELTESRERELAIMSQTLESNQAEILVMSQRIEDKDKECLDMSQKLSDIETELFTSLRRLEEEEGNNITSDTILQEKCEDILKLSEKLTNTESELNSLKSELEISEENVASLQMKLESGRQLAFNSNASLQLIKELEEDEVANLKVIFRSRLITILCLLDKNQSIKNSLDLGKIISVSEKHDS